MCLLPSSSSLPLFPFGSGLLRLWAGDDQLAVGVSSGGREREGGREGGGGREGKVHVRERN